MVPKLKKSETYPHVIKNLLQWIQHTDILSMCCYVITLIYVSFLKYEICHNFFCRAPPAAYVSSQARGRIGAAAASLHHSHSNLGSKPHQQPTHSSRQCQILNPLSEAGDQTCILMDTSQVHDHWATMRTPTLFKDMRRLGQARINIFGWAVLLCLDIWKHFFFRGWLKLLKF